MFTNRICVLVLPAVLFFAAQAKGEDQENQLPARAKAILEKAESFELLSLDPDERQAPKEGAYFGFKVLGKTTVKDAETRRRIVSALLKGIEESKGPGAKCFDPRHGISAKHDGKTVDLVICFECHWVYVYGDGKRTREAVAVTTGKPQEVFDKVLADAKVPLPKGKQ